ncbi:unnamed protein product, partial [Ectocarpus sp. 4 AP-2014]
MQGGKVGSRPFTPVVTDAEKAKFDRSALSFLTTIPEMGNRPAGQSIDYDAFADSWNADVDLEEKHVGEGLVVLQTHNLVNRKLAHALKHCMNTSKKAINAKRTMEPYSEQVQMLRKDLRVEAPPAQSTPSSGPRPRTCVLQSGQEVTFPSVAEANNRPRPIPVLLSGSAGGTESGGGAESRPDRMDSTAGRRNGDGSRGPEEAASSAVGASQAGVGAMRGDHVGG